MRSVQNGFEIEPLFSVGSVLSRTFSTLAQHPLLFFGLGAIASLPSVLLNAASSASPSASLTAVFINTILGLLIQGAIAYGVFISLTGDDPTWGEVLGRGLKRIFYLFLLALVLWIVAVFFIFIASLLLLSIGTIKFLGILLVLVIGVIGIRIFCAWVVPVQVCVVEQLGPIASLSRSAELTRGYRWHLFALFLLLIVGAMVFAFIAAMVMAMIFPRHMMMGVGKTVISFITGSLSSSFFGVMCSVIYYDLRAAKEGLTLDALADIFD